MTTLLELLEQRPKMRYIFTGGKGGVGKTAAAAGLAYHLASKGDRVLLASLNTVHSLSSLFGQSLSGRMVDYILKEGESFDRVIFDTAAVANAVRLIGLSKIYGLWLTRMIDSRKEALSMRVQLSFRKEKVMEEVRKDPLMADLISMNERFEKAKGVLVDPERTAFFFVTLPLALPIAVVRRFIGMVQKFNIPIGGVIVNEVLRADVALQAGAGEYLANKYHEQTAYMKVLYRDLGPLVRGYIPLYSSEVTGVDMVRRVSEDLMSFTPSFAAELAGAA